MKLTLWSQLVLVINIEIHGIIYQYFTQFNVMREPQFLFACVETSCTIITHTHMHTHTQTHSISLFLFFLLHTLGVDTSK